MQKPARKPDPTWFAFLVVAFMVVGLTGIFVSYAAPLPLARALARDAALNDAASALSAPDPRAALEALRPRLGDSADALLPQGGTLPADMPARIAAERQTMHARLQTEADTIALRLRVLLAIVTLTAAAFGAAILGAVGFQRREGADASGR